MKCSNKVFKLLPYDADMVASCFYIRSCFRNNLWTSASHICVELHYFHFHWKIYWLLHAFESEKLILWAKSCCNVDRCCWSVSLCAYQQIGLRRCSVCCLSRGYLLSRLSMMLYSGVHPHLRECPDLREMQPLSKEMETKYGPVISHYKGWRAASQVSSVAGTKPCHCFKDSVP